MKSSALWLSDKCVMSHTSMIRQRTCKRVISNVGMSHGTHAIESRHACQYFSWITEYIPTVGRVTHISTHTHAHTTRTSRGCNTCLNTSCHVSEWVMDRSCKRLACQRTKRHWIVCNALQHTATYCITLPRNVTLQHTATHCNTLQHTATHCDTLQHAATYYNTLQHTATHRNIPQQTATYCNILQHTATHCSTPQHSLQCNTTLCNPLQYTATQRHANYSNFGATPSVRVRQIASHSATNCNTLQHTATHCNTLQHTVTHCSLQHNNMQTAAMSHKAAPSEQAQHTATHCNTLQHTAAHCSTLHHTAAHCSTLQHTATHCNTLQHTALHKPAKGSNIWRGGAIGASARNTTNFEAVYLALTPRTSNERVSTASDWKTSAFGCHIL